MNKQHAPQQKEATIWPATWPVCRLASPQGSTAVISLHGGQLLSWQTVDQAGNKQEHFYLSPRINWQDVKQGRCAIRGGVPVCWPQFNKRGALVKHGFARLLPWALVQHKASSAVLRLTHNDVPLSLRQDAQGNTVWNHAFELELHVQLNDTSLTTQLLVRNTGTSPLPFTAALHSYFACSNIAHTHIQGANGLQYWDAVANADPSHPVQQGDISFTQEVDRVYPAFSAQLQTKPADAEQNTAPSPAHNAVQDSLRIQQAGFEQTVVWNPGSVLCQQLNDMPPHAYQHFACIEAAQIDTPITLPAGASWQGQQCCYTTIA